MSMPEDCFSVIIPTRNRRADLLECLHSLRGQSLAPAEIVIVDATWPLLGDERRVYGAAAGTIPV